MTATPVCDWFAARARVRTHAMDGADGSPGCWSWHPACAYGVGRAEAQRELAAEIARLRERAERAEERLAHAEAALTGDNEGCRLWMLDCASVAERQRKRAEAQLAAIRADLRLVLEHVTPGASAPESRAALARLAALANPCTCPDDCEVEH